MAAYDVAVIGAGVHGASAAFHLASRGVRTAVVEKTSPAGGPTGRSSAICRAYYTNAFLAGVAAESIAMFRDFEGLTGRSSGFRETGLLVLHPSEDEDVVRAQIAQESWWHQDARGDYTSDQNACYPTVRTGSGQCPESVGLGQVRYQYHTLAFTNGYALVSSAFNLDRALSGKSTGTAGGD